MKNSLFLRSSPFEKTMNLLTGVQLRKMLMNEQLKQRSRTVSKQANSKYSDKYLFYLIYPQLFPSGVNVLKVSA